MSKIAIAAGAAAVAAVSLLAPTAASAATKPQVTVAALTRTMTYGGATPALGYTVSGLAKGDKLLRNPTCTVPTHRNAGTYAISCSSAQVNTKKYTLRYLPAKLYVGRAPLYVAPNYAYKYYGDAEPAFGYTASGLVAGDKLVKTPTCTVAGAHTAAGRYALSCRGADAGTNYDLHYYDNNFDVARRPLVVGPDKQYVYFGSDEPALTYSALNLVDGEKLAAEPTCTVAGEHVHVGTYTITCTGAKASPNYQLNEVTNPYTVIANASVVKGDKAAVSRDILGQPTGASLRAQLYLGYPYPHVFAGQKLTFTSGDATLCADVVTDENGYATCDLGANVGDLVKNGRYTVTYTGQGKDIAGSSDTVENG